ncbi:hypothetical protein HPA02_07440 [Bisbaumannia pacifica]|uniref:Uncharacterized protein n=1 Tax=Bisbaumannia pacifica TaxID=77098 RepID=A0A510X679_9GAMM|nr:hypothetical protein HPA02_07440 [Halomonas pacifica]
MADKVMPGSVPESTGQAMPASLVTGTVLGAFSGLSQSKGQMGAGGRPEQSVFIMDDKVELPGKDSQRLCESCPQEVPDRGVSASCNSPGAIFPYLATAL